MAETLSKYGFNLNFAPVLDLKINDNSFIASEDRCFSGEADNLIKHAKEFIDVHLKNNVIPVCKHFPGQGSASGDSHEGLVDVTNTWQKSELKPYQILIKYDSIKAIMTSHLIHKKLDPNFHQAMMEIEDDAKEAGTIVQEIQKGFTIKDRLLRPSLVGVSKKVTKKAEKTEQNQENSGDK